MIIIRTLADARHVAWWLRWRRAFDGPRLISAYPGILRITAVRLPILGGRIEQQIGTSIRAAVEIVNEVAADALNDRSVCSKARAGTTATQYIHTPRRFTDEASTETGLGIKGCTGPSASRSLVALGHLVRDHDAASPVIDETENRETMSAIVITGICARPMR